MLFTLGSQKELSMSLQENITGSRGMAATASVVQTETRSGIKTGWTHIANSWRMIAERMIAERTGGELSGWALFKPASARPMQYQQSFYTLG